MLELHWLGVIKSPVDEIVGYHFVLFSSVLLYCYLAWLWDKQPAEIQELRFGTCKFILRIIRSAIDIS